MEAKPRGGPRSAGIGAVTAAPGSIDGALGIVRQNQGEWSVLISSRREHAKSRRLVYHARAALEESLIALHVTDLSPLGAAVLTEMAQPLVTALAPEQILPALTAVEAQIRCLTVTPSVMDMNEPKVPLWLHARSWIPGGTYIAERGHMARSASHKKPHKTLDRFPAAVEGDIAVVAESDHGKGRGQRINSMLETLLEHLGPKDVIRRPNLEPSWWGSAAAAQVVLAPTNLGAAVRQAAEVESVSHEIPARVLTTGHSGLHAAATQKNPDGLHLQEENE